MGRGHVFVLACEKSWVLGPSPSMTQKGRQVSRWGFWYYTAARYSAAGRPDPISETIQLLRSPA
jgi:hypothetical protein